MSLKDDISRLVDKKPEPKRLDGAGNPAAIREQTGIERRRIGQVSSEEVTVTSTDGLFTFTVRIVKT